MEQQLSLLAQYKKNALQLPSEKVIEVRGVKVMLDKDVAEALGTDTRHLNENAARSPKWEYLRQQGNENDFRFQLTADDAKQLRSQIATSSDFAKLPWVYTRKGCSYFATSMNSSEACAQAVNLVEVFDKVQDLKKLSPAQALHEMTRQMVEQEERLLAVEASVADLKAHVSTASTDYYSISGFASLKGLKLSVTVCNPLGKKAVKLSNEMGYSVYTAHSEIFGTVNTYHLDVLNVLFVGEKLLKAGPH